MQANIDTCSQLIRQAAAAGATLVCTPENTARMTALTQKTAAVAAPADPASAAAPAASSFSSVAAASAPASSPPPFSTHPVLTALSALASELNIFILVGSIAVRPEQAETEAAAAQAAGQMEDKRVCNRSVLLAPRPRLPAASSSSFSSAPAASAPSSLSQVVACYDKIHLFDVPALNGAESYLESARIRPGDCAPVVAIPDLLSPLPSSSSPSPSPSLCVQLGMTICYDLRFPALFRSLAQAGANVIVVPSAFTVVTGRAHWHALLRARAIETGAYIVAPAQVGVHPGSRTTYGHSLIVDPWGTVMADAGGDHPGIIVADIDLATVQEVRRKIPSLTHDRPFTIHKVQ